MTCYVIISGVDGSGKTSIINGVKAALEREGKSVSYIWMRYNNYLVTILHAVAKLIGLSKKEETPMGKMWVHYFYKNPFFCWAYIRCKYIDAWVSKNKPLKFSTDYVICDRWVNDILIDIASEIRQPGIIEGKWLHKFQTLLPDNNKQFVVIRSKKEVLDCRVENTFNPAFEKRYELYDLLSRKDNVIRIENDGALNESIENVLDIIRN